MLLSLFRVVQCLPIQKDINGKWRMVKSENFDAYLQQVGVGMLVRNIAAQSKPDLDFIVNGDEWEMKSVSLVTTYNLKWKLGETFDGKTADGRPVTSTFNVENDKLVQREVGKNGGPVSTITRYVENGKLIIICEANGVKATRVYEPRQ